MAINEEKNSGTSVIKDAGTYTPSETGSNQGLASAVLYRDSAAGSTSSDYQQNNVSFVQDVSIVEAALLSFNMFVTGGTINEAALPTGSGTFDAQINSTATDEGGFISTLSGMLQIGTIVSDLQLTTFANASMPSLTYNISDGDILYMLYESNGGTLTAPTTASSGDSYLEISTDAMTGSPLTQGKIYKLEATADMTSESEGNWLSGSNSGSFSLIVVKAAAVAPAAGGHTNALSMMGIG